MLRNLGGLAAFARTALIFFSVFLYIRSLIYEIFFTFVSISISDESMITFGDFMAAILNDNDGFKVFMCLNGFIDTKKT